MAKKQKVQDWFKGLNRTDKALVETVDKEGTKSAGKVRPMLLSAGLIEPDDTDEEVITTLRMRF